MTTPDFIVASDGGSNNAGTADCFGSWGYVVVDKHALSLIKTEITRVLALVGDLKGASRTRLINKTLNLTIPLDGSCGILPGGTNNAGEIAGAYHGLSRVRGRGSVAWYTDSKYTLESVTKWCRKKDRNDPSYINGKAIFELADLYDEMLPYGLCGRHIHSHQAMPDSLLAAITWYVNERADKLCTQAMKQYTADLAMGKAVNIQPVEPALPMQITPVTNVVPPAPPMPVAMTSVAARGVMPTEMKLLLPFMGLSSRPTNQELENAVELYNVVGNTPVILENVIILESALMGLTEAPDTNIENIFGGGITTLNYTSADWWKKINKTMFSIWVAKVIMYSIQL